MTIGAWRNGQLNCWNYLYWTSSPVTDSSWFLEVNCHPFNWNKTDGRTLMAHRQRQSGHKPHCKDSPNEIQVRYESNKPIKNKQLNITTTSLCNRVFTTQSSLFNFALFLRPRIKHGNHGNLLFRMILWCMEEFLSTLTETCTYLTPDQPRTRGHRMSQCKIWHQRWPQTAQLPLRESHLSSWLLAPRIANIFQREWPEGDLLKLHCQNLMAHPKRWEKRPYFHLIQVAHRFLRGTETVGVPWSCWPLPANSTGSILTDLPVRAEFSHSRSGLPLLGATHASFAAAPAIQSRANQAGEDSTQTNHYKFRKTE